MHDQGIVHGNLQAVRTPSISYAGHMIHIHLVYQTNVLVDKDGTVWIAGLGNASVLPHATAKTVPGDRISTNRPSRSRVPQLTWPRMSPDPTEPPHPTKASDIYAFGIMAWEVWTGSFVWHHPVCSLEIGTHGAAAVLWYDRDCSGARDAKRG